MHAISFHGQYDRTATHCVLETCDDIQTVIMSNASNPCMIAPFLTRRLYKSRHFDHPKRTTAILVWRLIPIASSCRVLPPKDDGRAELCPGKTVPPLRAARNALTQRILLPTRQKSCLPDKVHAVHACCKGCVEIFPFRGKPLIVQHCFHIAVLSPSG